MSDKSGTRKSTDDESQASEEKDMNDILELPQVLELLGVTRTTLYRRINEGDLTPLPKAPGAKKRSRLRFRRADIEKLLRG